MATKKRIEQDRGKRARDAILAELRRREDAGLPAPTIDELATVAGVSHSSAMRHVKVLRADGKVRQAGPQLKRALELTRKGRISTNTPE